MIDEYVQAGGEKYLKFARAKLQALVNLRADLRLPVMRKHFVPDASTRIDLEATAEGSRIRIFAGDLRYVYFGDFPRTAPPVLSVVFNNVTVVGSVTPFVLSRRDYAYIVTDNTVGVNQTGTYSGTLDPVTGALVNWPASWTNTASPTNGIVYTLYGSNTGPNASFAFFTESAESILYGQRLVAYNAALSDARPAALYAGMTNSDVAVLAAANHPTFSPPPTIIFSPGETIIVGFISYVYGPVYTETVSYIGSNFIGGTAEDSTSTYAGFRDGVSLGVTTGTNIFDGVFGPNGTRTYTNYATAYPPYKLGGNPALRTPGGILILDGVGGPIGSDGNYVNSPTASTPAQYTAFLASGVNNGFFPTTQVSGATLVGAKKYKYNADTATWSYLRDVPIYDKSSGKSVVVSSLPLPKGSTYFGNLVFISQQPLQHEGAAKREFETTYKAQATSLKAETPPLSTLRTVSDALFP